MILAIYFQTVPQRNDRYIFKENKIRREEKERERTWGQKCSKILIGKST